MSRAGVRPLAPRAGTAQVLAAGRREWRAAANDNRRPLHVLLAKATAVAAIFSLAALAALAF